MRHDKDVMTSRRGLHGSEKSKRSSFICFFPSFMDWANNLKIKRNEVKIKSVVAF